MGSVAILVYCITLGGKLTSARLVQRVRMVLLAAEGMQNKDIAALVGVGRVQVSRWRERYARQRLAGIGTLATFSPGKTRSD